MIAPPRIKAIVLPNLGDFSVERSERPIIPDSSSIAVNLLPLDSGANTAYSTNKQDRKPAKNAMFRFLTFPYRQHGLIVLALLRYLQATVQGSLREKTATQVLVGALL